jgi:hypothetical protein
VRAAMLPAYPRKGWVTLSCSSIRASRWSARSSGGSFSRTSVEKTVLEAVKGVVFEHKRQDSRRQAVRISRSLPSHLQLHIEHVLDDLLAKPANDPSGATAAVPTVLRPVLRASPCRGVAHRFGEPDSRRRMPRAGCPAALARAHGLCGCRREVGVDWRPGECSATDGEHDEEIGQ